MSQIIATGSGGGGGGTTSFETDAGTATPIAGVIQILGGTDVTTSGATNVVTINAAFTLDFDADAGTATPAANTINIVGGTNVTTSAAGSTVTINAATALMPWVDVSTATQAMAINTGYIVIFAGLSTLTLPAIAPQGTVVSVVNTSAATSFDVQANVGQAILANNFGTPFTSVQSNPTDNYVGLDFLCIVANTDWQVRNPTGQVNYTV